ncbi:Fic family protein [Spirosomataceae bacterium TFI 002]|nr:Fic family protein [Spirosomataceae bacterium TFI 002]
MRPTYDITHNILKLSTTISRQLGEASVSTLSKPSPVLRDENELKSVYASLKLDLCNIEIDDLRKLLRYQRASGNTDFMLHGYNALKTYRNIRSFEPSSKNSFLGAHKMFMGGIMDNPGRLRIKNVIHERGSVATHLSPPPHLVGFLMDELFGFLKKSNEIPIIKSCLFFYEMLTIEPFSEGNGRVSRFWFKVLLRCDFPVFEYIPLEHLIYNNHDLLIDALTKSGRIGKPTDFLEFMLTIIDTAIQDFFKQNEEIKTAEQRLAFFVSETAKEFSRKDYMVTFNQISTATASRDLKLGVEKGLLKKEGDKRKTIYKPEKQRVFVTQ